MWNFYFHIFVLLRLHLNRLVKNAEAVFIEIANIRQFYKNFSIRIELPVYKFRHNSSHYLQEY